MDDAILVNNGEFFPFCQAGGDILLSFQILVGDAEQLSAGSQSDGGETHDECQAQDQDLKRFPFHFLHLP